MRTILVAALLILVADTFAVAADQDGKGGDTCGGFIGKACPADQWCNYPPGATCGMGDQTGVCRPRPDKCVQQFIPVCACNNQTYGSACSAAQAGFDVAYFGPCRKE